MTVPIGTILPYGGKVDGNAPGVLERQGWLVCDGEAVSREDYHELYSVIGGFFGDGDNVSTFHLPDLKGRFVRGVDHGEGRDPDAQDRTPSNVGANGGDNVGSLQEDRMQSHKHPDYGHTHPVPTYWCWANAENKAGGSEFSNAEFANKVEDQYKTGHAQIGDPINAHDINPVRHGWETRPKNIYVNWIIKAKDV